MKSTGIVRKIDNLGRVVLPIELRKIFQIEKEDPVEIFVDDQFILLKKYHPVCIFCDKSQHVTQYKGKAVCKSCLTQMKKLLK